ncbi:hypothetical protein ACHAWF_010648 [Thalassiosira exigua]
MIGHCDTWLIDSLQQLVKKNHNMGLYPHWTNASGFKDTPESFDTVVLHSSDLHQALEIRCSLFNLKRIKLSRDQKFLCQAQGVQLPFLPFKTSEEKKHYSKSYSVISKSLSTKQQSGGAITLMERRDFVQSGSVGLQLLVKRLLNYHLPELDEDRFSDWNKDQLDKRQIDYGAKDALAHLEVSEALWLMPDLNLRLKKADVAIGQKVDFVPRFGYFRNISCMATRTATGVVVDLPRVCSPAGIEPSLFNRGKDSFAIEIETIYSSAFIVPKYSVRTTGAERRVLLTLAKLAL